MLGEYVECGGCRGTYKPAVLDYDPSKAEAKDEAEFLSAMRRVMVLMMLADGVVDEGEIKTIQEVFGKIAKRTISRDEVEKEIAAAKAAGGAGVEDYCKKMTGFLNDSGKEMVVRAAFLVAAADGKFEEEEKSLLSRIAKSLELSPAHYRGIIVEMTEQKAA